MLESYLITRDAMHVMYELHVAQQQFLTDELCSHHTRLLKVNLSRQFECYEQRAFDHRQRQREVQSHHLSCEYLIIFINKPSITGKSPTEYSIRLLLAILLQLGLLLLLHLSGLHLNSN